MKLNVQDLVDKKFSHSTGKFAGQANISQFAKAVGIERIAALKIYNGETASINFDVLESICQVLECTPNDIIVTDNPKVSRSLDRLKRIQQYYNELNQRDDSK